MLRLLRRRDLPWHRRVRARFQDVDGIVIIGDVHGEVRQLAGQSRPLRLDWKPLRGHDPLAWLHWKSRLAPTLVAREREMASLRRWAEDGRGVRARVLSGEGGTGKTRLAAELAQELRSQGWQAGFADLRHSGDGAGVFRTGSHGTLILLDYPEEHREATRELLRDLATLEGNERLRVLLLSRRGDDLWQPEIDRADAFGFSTRYPWSWAPFRSRTSTGSSRRPGSECQWEREHHRRHPWTRKPSPPGSKGRPPTAAPSSSLPRPSRAP